MKKNFKFKPTQIGGIRERIAAAMMRTNNEMTEDEADIFDLIANPSLFGKDNHGSHDRLRAAFERILTDAAEKEAVHAEFMRKIRERHSNI